MSCTILTTITGVANLILGLCLGYYISKRQQREFARHTALLKLKESLISDKVRLVNEVPNNQVMGNVTTVQNVVENLRSIFKNIDLTGVNAAWDHYYKNEHRRKPFESDGPKRKEESIKAIDSIINFIENNLS